MYGADALAAEITRRDLHGRAFTSNGHAYTRATIPGAPSASVDVECVRRGVSWCYTTPYGEIGESPVAAADHIAWLYGVHR